MWTRTKPDKAGWWWYREKVDEPYIFAINSERMVMMTGVCNPINNSANVVTIPIETLSGEWQPVQPPQD